MDCSFKTEEGRFNFRVGAIIIQDNSVLMVRNSRDPYYYSLGGRVKMNEALEDAVKREAFEETGVHFEIERLAYIHENFFTLENTGEKFHEISFYYFMKHNEKAELIGNSFTEDGVAEYLDWIPLNNMNEITLYPTFFKTELLNPTSEIKHIITTND